MDIQHVSHESFKPYGQMVTGFSFEDITEYLIENTPRPTASTVYVASEAGMEALPSMDILQNHIYGGMDIQIGYCNGHNVWLNCLEYHVGSETIIAAQDIVLLLAHRNDIVHGGLDTSTVRAFSLRAGEACTLYETTLHYAPCTTPGEEGFRVAIVLLRNTNQGGGPLQAPLTLEDKMLFGRNKWLMAHPDAPEVKNNAYAAITGKNIRVE